MTEILFKVWQEFLTFLIFEPDLFITCTILTWLLSMRIGHVVMLTRRWRMLIHCPRWWWVVASSWCIWWSRLALCRWLVLWRQLVLCWWLVLCCWLRHRLKNLTYSFNHLYFFSLVKAFCKISVCGSWAKFWPPFPQKCPSGEEKISGLTWKSNYDMII